MKGVSLSTIIAASIIFLFFLIFVRLCFIHRDRLKFFSVGYDSGFKQKEIRALWKLSKICELENPVSLFYSVPTLNKCISTYLTRSRATGIEKSYKVQSLLEKLYQFRTRIALKYDDKRNLENTIYIDEGQKFSLILPGKGVFHARLLKNGRDLIVSQPRRFDKKEHVNIIPATTEWVGKTVSVYFWRKGDAMYCFDGLVFDSYMYLGNLTLKIKHSSNLIRTQKRQSIRMECKIYAQMYMIRSDAVDFSYINPDPGYKCLLEDISEDGALIRIGGKGVNNVRIKIQFVLENTMIVMFGVVKAVEYNKSINQSRLHFECRHIDSHMRNTILTYVYDVLPDREKERQLAMIDAQEQDIDFEEMASKKEEEEEAPIRKKEFVIPMDISSVTKSDIREIEQEKVDDPYR